MKTAINLTKKKKKQARLHYILGQLYAITDEEKKSFESFGVVLKSNPPYEMFFNAQMNRAKMGGQNRAERNDLTKTLSKMLKDEKNKEISRSALY